MDIRFFSLITLASRSSPEWRRRALCESADGRRRRKSVRATRSMPRPGPDPDFRRPASGARRVSCLAWCPQSAAPHTRPQFRRASRLEGTHT